MGERPERERPASQQEKAGPATPAPSGLPPVELGPIIKSKIQAPALRSSTLSRQRLIDQLREATTHRLTLLIAEAGYGKTTLLADFVSTSGTRTMWYRLDPTDADVITWANHIIAAAREKEPDFGEATLRLMSQLATGGPPKSAYVSSVIGELGELEPVTTLLVLDDFHLVDESEEAREFVSRLIKDAPPWLRICISSRRKPELEVARVAANDDLAELTTDDLRFSRSETDRLFAESYGFPLDPDVLLDIDAKTQGWAASLQLVHGSIRGRPPGAVQSLVRALSGAQSPIYDFLAEEVLANLPPHLDLFLLRVSILQHVSSKLVVALFADASEPPSTRDADDWIDEADRLGLLSRSSQTSDARQLHPLLRDFLSRRLRAAETADAIRRMHLRVAREAERSEPLMAARHFLEAGDEASATACLGNSVMLTMGSGQWGAASDLIDRLEMVPADPAVATIQARRLISDGSFRAAADLLSSVEIDDSSPEVRATFRHARLTLGWRTGNRDLMFEVLDEILGDPETPAILGDIAQVFVDASPMAAEPVPLPLLARRLSNMALAQSDAGHYFYSAISLHNAAVAYFNAAEYQQAVRTAGDALATFGRLSFFAVEQLSTHTLLAMAYLEMGDSESSGRHVQAALESGHEFADVAAELASASHLVGQSARAADLLTRAKLLQHQGQSDLLGDALCEAAQALVDLERSPGDAVRRLQVPVDSPLDLGYSMTRDALLASSLVIDDQIRIASGVVEAALEKARLRHARRAEVRLRVLQSLLLRNTGELRNAMASASASGELALLELADVVTAYLDLVGLLPPQIRESATKYPDRWLPLIRRRLGTGNTPVGRAAAAALDSVGSSEDVGLLRAYAKTYSKRGPGRLLGKALARRVSPKLLVDDLGRTSLAIGDRRTLLSSIRRKPAAVLLFLITRTGFTANREQVIDALWRESDPDNAANNLHQSLYFLRREIDPWFEDDVSVDYVGFQGDVVWLDTQLVRSSSSTFVASAADRTISLEDASALLMTYRAPFAPEFEYEEWAMAWRSRVHATFLELAHASIGRRIALQEFDAARSLAAHVVHVDEAAFEIERVLVWLYARLGRKPAARVQYEHLAARAALDGFELLSLVELLDGPSPL